ncbi:MAG: hypothetical protein LC778_15890 [Acidobacteria bacterium]|nr:hypothetical protein [Acidobacteriota bacterium]
MKIKIPNAKTAFLLATALFCLFVTSSEITAQTNKRRTKRNTLPVIQPTPPPQQTVPTIVSRAEDYQNENQTIVAEIPQTQTEAETLDQRVDKFNDRMKEINSRVKSLESTRKNDYDEKQKRLLLNLDILSRAEQRAESLRKQLFELVEKENSLRTRLEQIQYDARPEIVDRAAALSGSLRPEEIRDQRRKSLEVEKRNLESLLSQIQTSRTALELNVQKADQLVEKVRFKLEKEIDDALAEDKEQ